MNLQISHRSVLETESHFSKQLVCTSLKDPEHSQGSISSPALPSIDILNLFIQINISAISRRKLHFTIIDITSVFYSDDSNVFF